MTRSSSSTVVPHVVDLESIIRKQKDKAIGESSGFDKKIEDFEPNTPEFEEENETESEEEMENIADIPMGEYKRRMHDDTGPGLMQPAIPATSNFELKGHILAQLKDIPFYGKGHEDAYKHIDDVNDIVDYFNIPNVPHETILLWMLPVTFKGAAKDWLKSLP